MSNTNTDIWAQWTNDQDPTEFVTFFADQGVTDIDEMCATYVNDAIEQGIFGSETPDLNEDERAEVASDLADYLRDNIDITVEVSEPCPTDTGVRGGLDLDVDVYVGNKRISGQCTLVWEEHNNRWAPYGMGLDFWLSGELVTLCRTFEDLADRIEAEASEEAQKFAPWGEIPEA